MRLPTLMLPLLVACTCGDPAPAILLDAGAPRACEGPVSLLDVDASELELDAPGSLALVRSVLSVGAGAMVLHDVGSFDAMGLGALPDLNAPRYEPWTRVPNPWGLRLFRAAEGGPALLVADEDEVLRWTEYTPEGPTGPGVAFELDTALGELRNVRQCGPGRLVVQGCAPGDPEGRFALVDVDASSGLRTSPLTTVPIVDGCGDASLPRPGQTLRGCVEHGGQTSVLLTGFATADGTPQAAGALTWDEAGEPVGDGAVLFGASNPRDLLGALATADAEGALFVLFASGDAPFAAAYRVEDGEARRVANQLLRPFGDALVLGSARLSETRSLLVYRQGAFLSAMAFEAGGGFEAPVLITNELGTDTRLPPLETSAGVFVPAYRLRTWLQLCEAEVP